MNIFKWLSLTIFLITALNARAQSFYLRGAIRDAFTNAGIEDSYVAVLNSDSTVVASGFAKIPYIKQDFGNGVSRQEKDNTQGAIFQLEIPKEGEYILYVNMLGYEPDSRKIELRMKSRNKPVTIDDIFLIPNSKELEELTVTGTKLKVYHKGDTLVYDTNAFVMDKHNVLEDLVKKLPGVEFRDGRVFVNGRFVDNIVIGGKDFLKSDPQQLMAMLPAYVVDKLKFYDKSGEQSKTMGKDMHDSSYVMDVTMKRDYHGSWLGNIDLGAGTEKRWGGVGFVMHFDDRQAFSLSLDANNLGLARMATDVCTDIENNSALEDSKNLQANLGYSYYPSDKLRIDTHASVRQLDKKEGTNEIFTSNTSLQDQIMRQTSQESNLRSFTVKGDASLTIRPRKGIYGLLSYSFDHDKENGDNQSESLTRNGIDEIPDSLLSGLLLPELPTELNLKNITNAYRDISSSDNRTSAHKAAANTNIAIGENLLRIFANFKADDGDYIRNRNFLSRIFSKDTEEDKSISLFDTHVLTYNTTAGIDYDINYADNNRVRGILTPFYRFDWIKENDDRMMYNCPLADCSQNDDINIANSRWINGATWRHTAGASLKHEFQIGESGKWMMLTARMTTDFERKGVNCTFANIHNNSKHEYILFSPDISLRLNPKSGDRRGSKSSLELKVKMSQTAPSTNELAEYSDTSDPLNIYMGNPNLKKQTKLETLLEMRHYFEKSRSSIYATLRNLNTWNAIAMKSIYDMTTGIRTIMPVNAGIGREISLDCGYGLPLSGQSWWLNIAARGNLSRCTNLTAFTDIQENQYINFGNYLTRVTLRHNAPSGKVMASYMAMYQGSIISGSSAPGTHMRSLIQNLTLNLKLPAGITFSTNCNVISRFGYIMPSLDRTIFLMDAAIEKSILNDRLNFKVSATDIFRQRKNAFSIVDGAGTTESLRTRFIPSYVLFSVYYQWSHTPRKGKIKN